MQPGQQKITQFDPASAMQAGDIIPFVRGGQNRRINVEQFTGVIPDGWQTPGEIWTFASFGNNVGVINVPEGNINRYPTGTRVWFKQGTPTATDRYGVVIASTTTTLTVVMLAGTILGNLTIQQPAISSEVAPRTAQNIDWVMFDIQSGTIATNETVNSAVYSNLATVGPTATVTIGASGRALVSLYTFIDGDVVGNQPHMGFAMSGANTAAANDSFAISGVVAGAGASASRAGGTFLVTGLSPGATTFTAKYKRLVSGNGIFKDRRIIVEPK